MSAKKGAPALYELYHSGKTPRKGLFGKSKPAESKVGDVKDIPMAKPQAVERQKVNVGKAFAAPVVTIKGDTKLADGASRRSILQLLPASVTFTLPMWLVILGAFVLLVTFMAMFSIGHNFGSGQGPVALPEEVVSSSGADNPTGSDNNAGTSPEMHSALNNNTSALSGSVTDRLNTVTGAGSNAVVGTTETIETVETVLSNPVTPGQRPVKCMIICSHPSVKELTITLNFFIQNGLPVEIAKLGSSQYVLVTKAGFASTNDSEFKALKDKVVSIGEKYIGNRPADGPRFNLSTFRSAYSTDTKKLDYNIN